MKNDPAFPVEYSEAVLMIRAGEQPRGLTKRELFAAMALQGFIASNMETPIKGRENIELLSRASVVMADALIAELEKQK